MELILIFLEFSLYYAWGQHHSKIPFLVASALVMVVLVITTMALYQSIKHRNDSEPW